METTDSPKKKKVRKYSIGGLIVGGLLSLSTLGNLLMVLRNPKLPPLILLVTLVPAVAIIVRSFRPPIGFGRGLIILLGGAFTGQFLFSLRYAASEKLVANLILGAIGILLLWVGFKKTKTTLERKPVVPPEAT